MMSATDVSDHLQTALLARVAGDVVLMGTTNTMASAWGVTVTDLLSALRELLEAGRITVQMEPRGRVSVRADDRYTTLTDRPM